MSSRALFEKQCEDEVICSDFSPGILGIYMLKGPNSTSANKLNYSLDNPHYPNKLGSENLSQQGGVEIQLDMVNHNEQVDFEKLDNKRISFYSYDAHDSLKVRGKCHVQRRYLKLIFFTMVGVVLAMIGVGIAFEINSRKKQNIGNSSLTELDISQPTFSPSFAPSTIFEVDLNNIISGILGSDARCFIVGSDAWEGRRWVIKNDPFMTSISEWGDTEIQIMLQKFVLATIAFAISGQGAPNAVDWMKVEECESQYISCNQDGTIRALVVGMSYDHYIILCSTLFSVNLFDFQNHVVLDNVVAKGGGTIPPEIGLLTTLNHLIIKNNPNLEGVVPSDIGNLVQLRQLGLYNNSLQGEIPDDLYTLSNLSFLNLGHNEFYGTISPLIERLTNLQTLVLDENEMSGPIVPLKLRKTKIVSLSLSGNKFSGQLAAAMKFLHKIEFLYLDKNDFSGSIPDELGDLTNLKSLALDRNRFRGTLPSQLGLLTDLNFLTMRRNDLTGNIPSELEGLNNLLTLNMAENKFGGSIPQAFGMLTSLKHLYLYENDLTGIFPNFTKNMPDLGKKTH
jgi:Leucine-rich repeat (LRR) protein